MTITQHLAVVIGGILDIMAEKMALNTTQIVSKNCDSEKAHGRQKEKSTTIENGVIVSGTE